MTYEEILSDLGKRLGLDLVPDRNNTCELVLKEEGLSLFLEPDANSDDLILAISLGELAPGKGSELLMRAALIANGLHRPFLGTLAYSRPTNQLVLFERAPMLYIDGKMTLDLMLPLIEEARRWIEAIKSGRLPDLQAK